jgi:hypothetical protein
MTLASVKRYRTRKGIGLRLQGREWAFYSSSPPDTFSFSPLWTFLCRRRFETTEKCLPQPSTSHANASSEVSTKGFNDKSHKVLTFLPSVAVHVRLQGRRAREPLIAHLALVLLLCVGWHLRAELAHHRLWAGRSTPRQEVRRAR